MALINCPECGKEISDQSQMCIHCGYPIVEHQPTNSEYICTINEIPYDLSYEFSQIQNAKNNKAHRLAYDSTTNDIVNNICAKTSLATSDGYYLMEKIQTEQKVPSVYTPRYATEQNNKIAHTPAQVQCPYCKSTNTKKITTTSKAVHTALFGILSMSKNSKQWHCDNCGSDF